MQGFLVPRGVPGVTVHSLRAAYKGKSKLRCYVVSCVNRYPDYENQTIVRAFQICQAISTGRKNGNN